MAVDYLLPEIRGTERQHSLNYSALGLNRLLSDLTTIYVKDKKDVNIRVYHIISMRQTPYVQVEKRLFPRNDQKKWTLYKVGLN